jgi:hypothetical protein
MSATHGLMNQQQREAQLVAKIVQKTAQGKMLWQRQPSAFTAVTPNSMQFDFIVSAPFGGAQQGWVSFVIRDAGREVLKIQRSGLHLTLPGSGTATPQLIGLVDHLFILVSRKAEDDLGEVLRKLDQF